MLVGDIVPRKGRRVAGENREVPVQRRYEGGSIFEEDSLQNVRPSRFSMAWRMRAGTGQDLLVW